MTTRIIEKISSLYENGASQRDVARHLGISKSAARLALKKQNPELKREKSFPKKPGVGSAPFGFAWIMGELVRDEREQKIIQIMLDYYHRGMSFNSIAKKLSEQKIYPRSAGRWDNGTVRKLILKHTNKKEGTKV